MSECEGCKDCKCGEKKGPPPIERASMVLYSELYKVEWDNLCGTTVQDGKLVVYLKKDSEQIPKEFATYGVMKKVLGNGSNAVQDD